MSWVAIYAVAEVLAVASAIHAIFTTRTTQGTIAWAVGLIAFPWLGLPLYWMFGCRRFRAYSEAMKRAMVEHEAAFGEARRGMAVHQVPLGPEDGTDLKALTALSEEEFMRGDRLDLLIDGEATFEAILAGITAAKRQICVLVYIMRVDGLGTRLLEALAAKAAQGVEVCFLVDSLGSLGMTEAIMAKWRARGLRLATFCSSSGWRDRWRLNFRNHRKIVVIDGEVGFVGGHNIGDEYLGLDPKYGRWRDTHVRVEGPTALQLQMVFAADWLFATGEKLKANWNLPPHPVPEDQRALVLASGPGDQVERCTLFFLNVILMAKKRLWIASPYFVPDEGILSALELAAHRGVEIRILVPQRADELLVWLASLALLTELTHPNIHLHRYTGGFLHQKTLLVDDHFTAIGSANFDNRSFRLNFEVTLAVEGGDFPARVAAMLERDFTESIEVGRPDYDSQSFLVKVGARAARLLAPIL
jgi:cardiolipin synthase